FLADCLCANFPESEYRVAQFNTRFKKITFPGDVLTATGEIKQVQSDGSVSVSLWTENQKGEVTAQGEALVKLLTK
ncbi:MAG: hypothetical protein EB120_01825, partial [Proteobacteria bacterium]|nr:hypothetical protein [Pseudomonadota bacterium]NDG25898.1 hypothetical protein [Pseudomonadota bacterium]